MTYEQKSAIVISQLRADRDRLLDALDNIRSEIKQLPYQRIFGNVSNYSLIDTVIEIIDKYTAESEDRHDI